MAIRHFKLNDVKIRTLAKAIEKGLGNMQACVLADINYNTFSGWLRAADQEIDRRENNPGKKPKKNAELFVRLSEAIQEAKVQREQTLLGLANDIANGKIQTTERRVKKKLVKTDGDKTQDEYEIVSEYEITRQLPPDTAMIKWLLQKHSSRYDEKQTVTIDWRTQTIEEVAQLFRNGETTREEINDILAKDLALEVFLIIDKA